jgi:RNAse (barnase) inhibitor barstar
MKKLLALVALLAVNFAAVQSQAGMYDAPDKTVERESLYGASVFESNYKVSVLIDGREIKSMKRLHAVLKDAFNLPKTYGANLDALYDVLTDSSVIQKNWEITIMNGKYIEHYLGAEKEQALLDTLNDAFEQNNRNGVYYWR